MPTHQFELINEYYLLSFCAQTKRLCCYRKYGNSELPLLWTDDSHVVRG